MSVQVHASWPEELPEGWVRHRGFSVKACGTATALVLKSQHGSAQRSEKYTKK
jgi:hypothetical protein